jgi:hypothetical protein
MNGSLLFSFPLALLFAIRLPWLQCCTRPAAMDMHASALLLRGSPQIRPCAPPRRVFAGEARCRRGLLHARAFALSGSEKIKRVLVPVAAGIEPRHR